MVKQKANAPKNQSGKGSFAKAMSLLLALMMLLAVVPCAALADGETEERLINLGAAAAVFNLKSNSSVIAVDSTGVKNLTDGDETTSLTFKRSANMASSYVSAVIYDAGEGNTFNIHKVTAVSNDNVYVYGSNSTKVLDIASNIDSSINYSNDMPAFATALELTQLYYGKTGESDSAATDTGYRFVVLAMQDGWSANTVVYEMSAYTYDADPTTTYDTDGVKVTAGSKYMLVPVAEPVDGKEQALVVAGDSTSNNAQIIGWNISDNYGDAALSALGRQWYLDEVAGSENTYHIRNVKSGKVMELWYASTDAGTAITQYDKGTDNCQKWVFEPVTEYTSDTVYRIKNVNSGLYIQYNGHNTAATQQAAATEGTAQYFKLVRVITTTLTEIYVDENDNEIARYEDTTLRNARVAIENRSVDQYKTDANRTAYYELATEGYDTTAYTLSGNAFTVTPNPILTEGTHEVRIKYNKINFAPAVGAPVADDEIEINSVKYTVTTGENLVPNPSFELESDNSFSIRGWYNASTGDMFGTTGVDHAYALGSAAPNWLDGNASNITDDVEAYHARNGYSFGGRWNDGFDGLCSIRNNFYVGNNKTVLLTYWVKSTTANNAQVSVGAVSGVSADGDSSFEAVGVNGTDNADWTKVQKIVLTDDDTDSVQFNAYWLGSGGIDVVWPASGCNDGTNPYFMLDDISIVEVEAESAPASITVEYLDENGTPIRADKELGVTEGAYVGKSYTYTPADVTDKQFATGEKILTNSDCSAYYELDSDNSVLTIADLQLENTITLKYKKINFDKLPSIPDSMAVDGMPYVPADGATNLVPNPSLDRNGGADYTGWYAGMYKSGSESDAAAGKPNRYVFVHNDNMVSSNYNGTYALAPIWNDGKKGYCSILTAFKVEPGKTYYFAFDMYVRSQVFSGAEYSTSIIAGMDSVDNYSDAYTAGTNLDTVSIASATRDEWTKQERIITVADSEAVADPYLCFNAYELSSGSTSGVFFDNFVLVEVEEDTSLADLGTITVKAHEQLPAKVTYNETEYDVVWGSAPDTSVAGEGTAVGVLSDGTGVTATIVVEAVDVNTYLTNHITFDKDFSDSVDTDFAIETMENAVIENGTLRLDKGYVQLQNDLLSGEDEFTVSAFYQWTDTGANYIRLYDFGTDAPAGSYSGKNNIFYTPDNNSVAQFSVVQSGEYKYTGNSKDAAATWRNVTFTYKDGIVKIYRGGEYKGEYAINAAAVFTDNNTNYLGRSHWSADENLTGYIDDFRVYNVALTADEIAAIAAETPYDDYAVTAETALTSANAASGSISKGDLGIELTVGTTNYNTEEILGYGFKLDRQTDSAGTTESVISETTIVDDTKAAIFPSIAASNDVFVFTPYVFFNNSAKVYGTAVKSSLYTEVITNVVDGGYSADAALDETKKANANRVIANGGIAAYDERGDWRAKIMTRDTDDTTSTSTFTINAALTNLGIGFLYDGNEIYIGGATVATDDDGAAKVYSVITIDTAANTATLSNGAASQAFEVVYLESVELDFLGDLIEEALAADEAQSELDFEEIL